MAPSSLVGIAPRYSACRAAFSQRRHGQFVGLFSVVSPNSLVAHRRTSTSASVSASENPSNVRRLWNRFVRWSYRQLSAKLYPPKADICNCGVDLGIVLPRAELVSRTDIEPGSKEWRMQMFGAALYLHVAGATARDGDSSMLCGKDVLEVACMRGGGARYLAEVTRPRTYVASDNIDVHIDRCRVLPHDHLPHLRFEVADAEALPNVYAPESFDVILCIQAVTIFRDIPGFVHGASRVLRQGGRLLIADAFTSSKMAMLQACMQEAGLIIEVNEDISKAVHAVGLCPIGVGISYLRVVARKSDNTDK
eukprot:TRINITY_DN12016_c0_g1_i2.p1 TRINITY_DN12016_c0_g1~~TRINITY_DN12016_c0_g1_i2.p1  ORF type:complete len:329 (-),score=35.65 TRINITY_DN12016_c0_g1_i2:22-945(-)